MRKSLFEIDGVKVQLEGYINLHDYMLCQKSQSQKRPIELESVYGKSVNERMSSYRKAYKRGHVNGAVNGVIEQGTIKSDAEKSLQDGI